MNKLENPFHFDEIKIHGNAKITYNDLREFVQGGPRIGKMSVNGVEIPNYLFGGPCLLHEDFAYAPVYVRKLLGVGFKIAQIDIHNLGVLILGKTQDFIFLDHVENNSIFYFDDMEMSNIKSCQYQ
ncbi:MAG: hypothetical protein V4590_14630 [Bacteroidota bacterium]